MLFRGYESQLDEFTKPVRAAAALTIARGSHTTQRSVRELSQLQSEMSRPQGLTLTLDSIELTRFR